MVYSGGWFAVDGEWAAGLGLEFISESSPGEELTLGMTMRKRLYVPAEENLI